MLDTRAPPRRKGFTIRALSSPTLGTEKLLGPSANVICASAMDKPGNSVQEAAATSARPSLHTISTSTSSTSWDTQTVVADDEEDELRWNQQKVLQRRILPRDVSDRLEPFEAMPVALDRFAEALVSFYLLQYPQQTYVFNQNLNPHPVYTNFAIAMNAPACFQCILARSALYKISAGQYGTSLEKAELDTAIVEHKTNAIHRIRQLSERKTTNKDELVASIISIGTLEMRMGSTTSGDMHYSAVRRLLKGIGGPMNIRDLRLKRVMCFFECIYATPRNSYIWDRSDFGRILTRFNEYLNGTWEIWKGRSSTPDSISALVESDIGFLSPQSVNEPNLGSLQTRSPLRRKPTVSHNPYFGMQPLPEVVSQPKAKFVPTEVNESRASQNSSVSIVRGLKISSSTKQAGRRLVKKRTRSPDHRKQKQAAMQADDRDSAGIAPRTDCAVDEAHPSANPLPPPPPRQSLISTHWRLSRESALYRRLSLWDDLDEEKQKKSIIWDLACLFCLSAIVADFADRELKSLATYMSKLSKIVNNANLHVSENNSNMMWLIQTNDSTDEHSKRMWEVAAFTWVSKHLNDNVRRQLRDWLLSYLRGNNLQKKITLTAFDFSYDSSLSR